MQSVNSQKKGFVGISIVFSNPLPSMAFLEQKVFRCCFLKTLTGSTCIQRWRFLFQNFPLYLKPWLVWRYPIFQPTLDTSCKPRRMISKTVSLIYWCSISPRKPDRYQPTYTANTNTSIIANVTRDGTVHKVNIDDVRCEYASGLTGFSTVDILEE